MPLYLPYCEELRLKELRAKRKTLWKQFEDNPSEIHLAAKLKILDDQIAQPYQPSDHNADKLDDSVVTTVPEVGGLYLLLALSQRTRCQPGPAQPASRDSASERASHGPPRLAAQVSSGNATTTAQTAMLRPHRNVVDCSQALDAQKAVPVFREAGPSRRGRNQRKACRVDQKSQPQICSIVAQ